MRRGKERREGEGSKVGRGGRWRGQEGAEEKKRNEGGEEEMEEDGGGEWGRVSVVHACRCGGVLGKNTSIHCSSCKTDR